MWHEDDTNFSSSSASPCTIFAFRKAHSTAAAQLSIADPAASSVRRRAAVISLRGLFNDVENAALLLAEVCPLAGLQGAQRCELSRVPFHVGIATSCFSQSQQTLERLLARDGCL